MMVGSLNRSFLAFASRNHFSECNHYSNCFILWQYEVDRYITWPGQALSYKIGEIQLSDYRASAEQQSAGLFNLKDFHDVVLTSIGPMDILGEEVDAWIQSLLNK